MNTIKPYLQLIAEIVKPMPLAMEFVLAHGLELQIKAHEFKRGRMGECFKNATIGALENNLLYCEGWATSPNLGGLPLEHAWCVDPQDLQVVDLTWDHPDSEYLGVCMGMREVAALTIKNQVYGVFGNLYRLRQPVQEVREFLSTLVWTRGQVN